MWLYWQSGLPRLRLLELVWIYFSQFSTWETYFSVRNWVLLNLCYYHNKLNLCCNHKHPEHVVAITNLCSVLRSIRVNFSQNTVQHSWIASSGESLCEDVKASILKFTGSCLPFSLSHLWYATHETKPFKTDHAIRA